MRQYAGASVLYLFGGALGHPVADAILDALRQAGRLMRTQIRDFFSREKGGPSPHDETVRETTQKSRRPTSTRGPTHSPCLVLGTSALRLPRRL